jgi:hypothetical protein
MRLLILAPVLLLLLAGCASTFRADVTRFHKLERPSGQTIKIMPQDDRKLGSLEFQTYASMIAPELEKLGYKVVAPSADSDLIARVDYAVSDGNTVVRSYPSMYPTWYYDYYYPWASPWYGFHARDRDIRSYIVYPRRLDLQIVRADLKPTDPNWMVYEGHVVSQGRSDNLPDVMPLLIQALFTNFPGESGATNEVDIKLD